MTWDAIVVGAGPAGAVAAHGLAHGGMRVLLLDNPAPGPKIGEALPAAASRLLAACGLPPLSTAAAHRPLTGTLSAWGSGTLEATDFLLDPDGPGWRLDRARFDHDLRAAARAAGAVAHAARLRHVVREVDGWRVTADDGSTFRAAWLVDATGRAATVARRLGARRVRDDDQVAVFGIGQGDGAARLARTLVEARPDGWWYAASLPAGGILASFQVGRETARGLVRSPSAWLQALAATVHVREASAGVVFEDRLRAVEACSAGTNPLGGAGWIACGDAALAFDPIAGQGLFSALHGGRLASQVLLAGEGRREALLQGYVERHATIREFYRRRWTMTYAAERRWLTAPYWAIRADQETLVG